MYENNLLLSYYLVLSLSLSNSIKNNAMKIKTRAQALAEHLGIDLSGINEYRYRYGHTSKPVWAFEDAHYCITKGSESPAKDKEIGWNWQEVTDSYINQFGFKIWKHTV